MGLLSGLFPPGFPSKTLQPPLFYPVLATCPTHFILLDFITQINLGEEYGSLNSSLCSLLQSLVTSSLSGPFSNSILRHPQPTFLPQCKWPSFIPIQNRQNYRSVYLNLYIFGYQDYVVISFQWQQRLHERTSMLCYFILLNTTDVLSYRKHMKYSSKNS
jgi:hypothetical protein